MSILQYLKDSQRYRGGDVGISFSARLYGKMGCKLFHNLFSQDCSQILVHWKCTFENAGIIRD